jgi:dipeptidyl aminopeptidase/acylaminoacyl peptidase
MQKEFVERNVRYKSGMISLAGTIVLPDAGSNPGVVIIHGSGNSDRRGKWYQGVASYLASHGIAVLLPDKRGCNESQGDWREADFNDLALDALAGVEILSSERSVDKERIGLIGFSQGGWVVPIAAGMRQVSFVVSLSGATVTPREQFRYEHRQDLKEKGWPVILSNISFPFAELLLARRWHRWSDLRNFDPMPLWETLPTRTLFVFGEEDQNVPVQDCLKRLETITSKKDRKDFSVKVFSDSGHGLLEAGSQRIRTDLLQLLTEWIMTS